MPDAIVMPRVNANEDRAKVVRWLKSAGDLVKRGEIVVQIETTKAAVDIEASYDGYLHPVVEPGDFATVGDTLAWIAAHYDPALISPSAASSDAAAPGGDRLVSKQAAAMMAQFGLGPADIPGDDAIDLRRVQDVVGRNAAASEKKPAGEAAVPGLVDMLPVAADAVIIFGAAEQGLVVLDAFRSSGSFSPVCFLDDRPKASTLAGLPVFQISVLPRLVERGFRLAHVAIGAPEPKQRVAQQVKALGLDLVNAIHARAVVSPTARIGAGVYVGPGAIVGPDAVIGDYCQINNNATVPHHVKLGWGVRVSDGANIAGAVVIGERAYLGLGVTINTGCHIGAGATLVSGVSVFDEVPENAIVRSATTTRR